MKRLRRIKSKKAMATSITDNVRKAVFLRDKGKCVLCGSETSVKSNAHFIPRSQGGMGIEENIITLCDEFSKNQCHYKFDNGPKEEREEKREKIRAYLKSKYPNWDEEKLKYKKWSDLS